MQYAAALALLTCAAVGPLGAAELTLANKTKIEYVSARAVGNLLELTLTHGKLQFPKESLSSEARERFFHDAELAAASPVAVSIKAPPSATPAEGAKEQNSSLDRSQARAAAITSDALAKTVLEKSGVRATVCEMPQAGDGSLAAALALAGVAQVHALAPDAKTAEAASKPAIAAGVMGLQVVIETGRADALPLGDWVADLYLVANATDAGLKTLSATEAGRVLSPYRGVALVGNPSGTKGGLSKAALLEWAKGTGGTVEIKEDADGLWAVVKMPPLKGGDDWSHYYHGPDLNPVSKDTAILGTSYQLQAYDFPIRGWRNFTIVASAGRLFVANGSLYQGPVMVWQQIPAELVARSLYNGKVLWRRPLSIRFGDMGSLLVATPERLYVKDGTGVLVLNAETGEQISRIEVTKEPLNVQWLAVSDGVLLTLAGPKSFDPITDEPQSAKPEQYFDAWEEVANEGKSLLGWDAISGRPLWQFAREHISKYKLAATGGRVFLHVNGGEATALDIHTGRPLWKSPAPLPVSKRSALIDNLSNLEKENFGEPRSVLTPEAYVLFDPVHLQYQAFATSDGRSLWNRPGNEKDWVRRQPVVLGKTLNGGGPYNLLTGEPIAEPAKLGICPSASCGHFTAIDAGENGFYVGNGVIDLKSGKQIAPFLEKGPCGTGFFVADGLEVLYPNTCLCTCGWHGLMLVRAAATTKLPTAPRTETGAATPTVSAVAGTSDWTSYRADETRKNSSAAIVPAKSVIRWMFTPRRPVRGRGVARLPDYLEQNRYATQVIAVGDRVWFGTAEGLVVCLDRQTGVRQWEYWTAGPISADLAWSGGRIYAGSADGFLYSLDAATGQLAWRYRVAPEERRINVMGQLSSPWAVSAVLVHDGTAYAAAGVLGRLDGSVMCGVNAQTGMERWSQVFKDKGETLANGRLKEDAPTSGGPLAWYGGKVWWLTSDKGPLVIDPATGAWKPALDTSFFGDPGNPRLAGVDYVKAGSWLMATGKDMGILPGGWVAMGNKMLFGACDTTTQVLMRSGPDGIPADAKEPPQLLTLNAVGLSAFSSWASYYSSREIPVWDANEVLTYDNSTTKLGPPTLYRNFTEALNQAGDASVNLKQVKVVAGADDLAKVVYLNVPDAHKHLVLPDDLWQEFAQRDRKQLYGSMLLAGNAVVLTTHSENPSIADMRNGRMPNYGDWKVRAFNRTDRSLLFEVNLPDAPAPSGMSLTRDGDVLVPLVDGRIACIGGGAPSLPLPSASVSNVSPGLLLEHYATDVPQEHYYSWSAEDISILKLTQTKNAAELNLKIDRQNEPGLDVLRGFIDVPETGTYHFFGHIGKGGLIRFEMLDATGHFFESTFANGEWSAGSTADLYLAKGKHPIDVVVMPGAINGAELRLQWEGPGITKSDIPAMALSHN